jgi:hypothetical protein
MIRATVENKAECATYTFRSDEPAIASPSRRCSQKADPQHRHVEQKKDIGSKRYRSESDLFHPGRIKEPCKPRGLLWQSERSHQEDSHLGARDRLLGAVVTTSTARSNSLCCQLLDEGRSPVRRRYVTEAGSCADTGRRVVRPIFRAEEEDGHFGTRDRLLGAVVAVTTARGNSLCC